MEKLKQEQVWTQVVSGVKMNRACVDFIGQKVRAIVVIPFERVSDADKFNSSLIDWLNGQGLTYSDIAHRQAEKEKAMR